MKGVRKFQDKLKKDLQNKEFAKAFHEEEIFANLAVQIAKLREEKGLNQKELAKRLHTSQQMVSRLEDPHNQSFSLRTLVKLAQAFHKKLSVQFV
jgi:ribosome-binding protein aMBF1 (putative translation factor)